MEKAVNNLSLDLNIPINMKKLTWIIYQKILDVKHQFLLTLLIFNIEKFNLPPSL